MQQGGICIGGLRRLLRWTRLEWIDGWWFLGGFLECILVSDILNE